MAKQSFSPEIIKFFHDHLEMWPLAAENFENLKKVQRKPFSIGSFSGYVQFNPARITSNAAKVDPESIRTRKCFLCKDNRPKEQMEFELIPGWKLLVNPYPILDFHFTIAGDEHLPQEFLPEVAVEITKRLPGMVIFYNSEGAGASAPDHRHFQAVPKSAIPLLNPAEGVSDFFNESAKTIHELPFLIKSGMIPETGNFEDISIWDSFSDKPLNAFFWNGDEDKIRYILIPRKAHRPKCFYEEPPERRAFSPGALDMGGILVTPFFNDYEQVTNSEINEIYKEVAYSNTP